MNITRAQENMNHTVTCRPTNVLFSRSSLVTIASSLLSSRSSTTVVDLPSPSPSLPSRRLAVVDRPFGHADLDLDLDLDLDPGGRAVAICDILSLSLLFVYLYV